MNVKSKKEEIIGKGELYIAYKRLNINKVVRPGINKIISKVRSISLEAANNVKTLRPKEVRLFKEEFDEKYF